MSIPLKGIGWESIPNGIHFSIGPEFEIDLNMIEVRELRDDMEEAYMLSRGTEKLELMASEVLQYDKIYVGNNVLMVSDVLARGGPKGEEAVLQFGDSYTELILPHDQQLTVWRAIA